jgi:hypothetical protein
MSDSNHLNPLPNDEPLAGDLKRAVDAVKNQPVPPQSQQNAINRAAAVHAEPRSRFRASRDWQLPITAGIAAALFISVLAWPEVRKQWNASGNQQASGTKPDDRVGQLLQESEDLRQNGSGKKYESSGFGERAHGGFTNSIPGPPPGDAIGPHPPDKPVDMLQSTGRGTDANGGAGTGRNSESQSINTTVTGASATAGTPQQPVPGNYDARQSGGIGGRAGAGAGMGPRGGMGRGGMQPPGSGSGPGGPGSGAFEPGFAGPGGMAPLGGMNPGSAGMPGPGQRGGFGGGGFQGGGPAIGGGGFQGGGSFPGGSPGGPGGSDGSVRGRRENESKDFDRPPRRVNQIIVGNTVTKDRVILNATEGVYPDTPRGREEAIKHLESELEGRRKTLDRLYAGKAMSTEVYREGASKIGELGQRIKDAKTALQIQKDSPLGRNKGLVEKLEELGRDVERLKAGLPFDDAIAGTGRGPGEVDAKKFKEIQEQWGGLPEKERLKAMQDLTRDIPPRHREVVENYFKKLANDQSGPRNVEVVPVQGIDPKVVQQALEAIQGKKGEASERKSVSADALTDLGVIVIRTQSKEDMEKVKKVIDDAAKVARAPQVWHRDRQRPSFARVYVGNGNSLELVSLQVTVTIEGPRARTVVDHIFRNPHARQLEGTFEYPLPTGASPSYFAMFLGQTRDTVPARFRGGEAPRLPADALNRITPEQLVKHVDQADWGRLQEAHVVGKQKALETYEEIVRGRIDPALLEYSGGNTFSGRVFPIPAKGYNRVILAYEELLPQNEAGVQYRFPLPDCLLQEVQLNLHARTTDMKDMAFRPADARREEGGSTVSFAKKWTGKGPGGEAIFSFTPTQPDAQVISGRQGESGPLYFYARVRPELGAQASTPFADHAVFMLDTSLSEYPDRFAVNMRLMKQILERDPSIKRFNVLAFNVAAAWLEPKGFIENTKDGRDKAFERLDGIVLEGATDLSAALDKLVLPGLDLKPGTPLNVFLLSDGQITWGDTEVARLVTRFEERCSYPTRFHCYQVGLGAENQELFESLTRKGGGVFQCYGEADLAAAAVAHRHECLHISNVTMRFNGPWTSDVLVAGRKAAVYPGGDLVVAGRINIAGKTRIYVEGTFAGKKFAQEYMLDITGFGELAPRGWAEIAVNSLLALNDPTLDPLVTAYCQQFGIGSRVASFLVLENENDFKRLNLEEERGKTVPGGDLAKFLSDAWWKLTRVVSAKEVVQRFLDQVEPRVHLQQSPNAEAVRRLLAALSDKDCELPESNLKGAIVRRGNVPPMYLAMMAENRQEASTYLTESRRRANAGDADGAVRVLSSIIEEMPTRSDALRLVGYRLLDLQQPAQAARLFTRVQESRPFEPHSYRDLARSLEDCGRYGLAALQYEIVLAGTWHNRFQQSLKEVTQEEYVRMMQEAIRSKSLSPQLANVFGERLERMKTEQPSDLRVTISWNTDATDVDLWVIEPDGTKCFYQHNRTKNGGELSQDQTQGYGPERYRVAKALPGEYTIVVHYYSANQNLIAGETHVNVIVTRNAGRKDETSERKTIILKKANEQVEAARVKF